MATVRLLSRRVFAAFCSVLIGVTAASAQYVSRNINMVSGTQWPGGDPFLQRQNEPSIATSTRNPLHIVGGANDYRTVDLPGLPDGEETGDAWLGLFISLDGGLTWRSTLVPGYPQDTSSTESIHQTVNGVTFSAAADPMVRSGLNGMFYYSGIALTRSNPPVSAVFVARYNDFNDREASNPVRYLGMSLVSDGRTASKFLDKPSLAVDIPRAGSQLCSAGGQFFPAGNVYVVYTDITTVSGATTAAKLFFSRSTDCGSTWSAPIMISGANTLNQGSVMAIDTRTGNLYVVWRRIARNLETDALLAARSVDGGKTFSAPVVIRNIVPFEQGTTSASFRTPMYPSAATDADGRLYVAWSERTGPSGSTPGVSDRRDGRIMLASSADGVTWSAPVMVAPTAPLAPLSGRGHQFMPALSYSSGKLMLVYYDAREDSTVGLFSWTPPSFIESRNPVGDLAGAAANFENVFSNYIQDAAVVPYTTLQRRHTLDLRASQASPGAMPVFSTSQRVSVYRFGFSAADPTIRQLEFNPPNFRMFKQGTVPFFGDYVDLAPQFPFLGSLINLPIPAPVFHAAWTDNRDVRPPVDGHWENYTPPYSLSRSNTSRIDGSVLAPCNADHTGMRNQNIYTSRITAGLFFGSPGNDKPLGTIERAFVVTVQNSKAAPQSYRLQIVNQPFGGKATFQQLPLSAPALTTLDITVNARSSASRTVFVTSILKHAPVGVAITEIPAAGGTPTAASLTSATLLNPDPTSPDIGSPDIGSPDIASTEVYTPDIGSPDIGSPDIGSPDIGSPDIGSPDIGSPDIGSPDIGSPDIGSPSYATPDIGSPDIGSPDIGSGSITDTTWPVTNDGNTTASYSTKLLQTAPIPQGLKLQLILHQSYKTPIARNCVLGTETQHLMLNNVPNPTVLTSADGIGSPDIGSPSVPTVAIPPGNSVNLTVRILDPAHKNRVIPATQFLTPVVIAHAVNTADLTNPNPQPAISMVITTPSLPDGVNSVSYGPVPMTALFGIAPLTWSVAPVIEGTALPYGLSLSPGGVLSGTPATNGQFTFTVNVTDSATPVQHHASRSYTIHISDPLRFGGAELPTGSQGTSYSASLLAAGGLQPLHYVVASGSLPPGLTMSDGGAITGTPTAGGTFSFMVSVSDSSQPAQTTQPVSCSITIVSLYTVVAHLTYNGQPVTPTTPPGFFLRNNGNNTVVSSDHIVWNNHDTVTISGIVAGNYGFEVVSKEGATAVRYPGSFYGFADFDAAPASISGFNLVLTRLIHLTSPEDNSVADASFACPPALAYPGLSRITWQNIEIPATYNYTIEQITCPYTNPTTIVSGSVTDNSGAATFPALAPNGPNDFYRLTMYAYSGNIAVGQIMTNAPNNGGWAWDLRFTVPQTLAITTTTLPDAFPAPSSYSNAISATGGTPPIHFAAIGNLPRGLTLHDNGTIDGAPTEVIFATFDVKATDSSTSPQSATSRFALQSWAQPSPFCGSGHTLFNNTNSGGVSNGGTAPAIAAIGRSYVVRGISHYHWNNGAGSTPQSPMIGFSSFNPWLATVDPATANVPANWDVTFASGGPVLNGTYTATDSEPSTWSQDALSNGEGFTIVCAEPVSQ